jgi:drug/metabolite transporter (DMT)-like permease
MATLHIIYILVCSSAFAAMDSLRKLLAGSIAPVALVFFVALGAVPAMMGWMVIEGSRGVTAGYFLPGLASVLLNLMANLGFVYSVKLSPLSRTIPLLSLTPVFTSLIAIPLLREYPSPSETMGIIAVVVGALILNLDQAEEASITDLLKALGREKGSILMAVVAFLWSLAVPLDKMAIAHSSSSFHGTVLSVGVTLGAFAALLGQRRVKDLTAFRHHPTLVGAMMICASLALAFQLLSIQVVLVSLVETLKRAIGCFFAILLGRLVFRESVTVHKLAAVAAMVLGVALILG